MQLFWWVSYKPSEKYWAITPKGKHKLSKTTSSTFQKRLFELCWAFFFGCKWKNCFEKFLRSHYLGTVRVFHSNTESRFGCASSRRLRLVLWLFTSCVWDVLWYRILIKTALFLEQNRNFPKRRWVRSKNVFLSSGGLVSLVVTKKSVLRTSSDLCTCNNTSFCSNAESRFGCARLRRLRLVFWLFTSCVWDVVGYRILRKTAFDFFGNVVFVVL